MGSYSTSNSNTSYLNAPLTTENNQGGVALAGNRDTLLGGSNNVAGSSNLGNQTLSTRNGAISLTSLDGGAIQRAFDSSDKSIATIADLTAKLINQQSAINAAASLPTTSSAVVPGATSSADANKTSDVNTNYTWWVVGGLVVVYFFVKKGKLKP